MRQLASAIIVQDEQQCVLAVCNTCSHFPYEGGIHAQGNRKDELYSSQEYGHPNAVHKTGSLHGPYSSTFFVPGTQISSDHFSLRNKKVRKSAQVPNGLALLNNSDCGVAKGVDLINGMSHDAAVDAINQHQHNADDVQVTKACDRLHGSLHAVPGSGCINSRIQSVLVTTDKQHESMPDGRVTTSLSDRHLLDNGKPTQAYSQVNLHSHDPTTASSSRVAATKDHSTSCDLPNAKRHRQLCTTSAFIDSTFAGVNFEATRKRHLSKPRVPHYHISSYNRVLQCDDNLFELKRRRLLSQPPRVFHTVRPPELDNG